MEMLHSLGRCWGLLSSRDRRVWASTVPLMALAAALEALSAGAVFVLLRAVGDASSLATLGLPAHWIPSSPRTLLVVGAAIIAVLQALKTALLVATLHQSNRANAETGSNLSIRLLRAYLAAPLPFHLRRNSTELVYTAMRSAEFVPRLVVYSAVSILAEILVLVGLAAVLFAAAPPASLAAMGTTLALLFALSRFTEAAFQSFGARRQEMEESAQRLLSQGIEGIKELRLRGREPFVERRFDDARREAFHLEARFATLSGSTRLLLETTFVFGILAVVLAMAWSGQAAGDLTPVLAIYAYAGFRVIPSANRIQMYLANIRFGLPSVERVRADLDACEGEGAAGRAESASPALAPPPFEDEIHLQDVAYSWDGALAPVLERIDVRIRRGESIGIVGETGAGKTTLLHILLGFLIPSGGRVLVDGRDIRDNLRAWQSRIGYVPQMVHLIDDTLARNVAFCLSDEEIDLPRVRDALRRAQLESFVAAQPQGIHTVLGQRGVRLSGGERQRVAIARALYDDPDVLVFDEGTSSLDPATEQEISRAIEELHGEKTMIVVAHRLTTVRSCDRLVLLEGGQVAATGTYDELVRDHAGFRRLAAMGTAPAAPLGARSETISPENAPPATSGIGTDRGDERAAARGDEHGKQRGDEHGK